MNKNPFTIVGTLIVDNIDSGFTGEEVTRIYDLLNSGTLQPVIDQVHSDERLLIVDIPIINPIPAFSTLLSTCERIHREFPNLCYSINFRLYEK